MSWQEERALLSPKEERLWWVKKLAEYPNGMAVNCSHMPSLDKTPVLRKLIEEGIILKTRVDRSWGTSARSRRTILRLPKEDV